MFLTTKCKEYILVNDMCVTGENQSKKIDGFAAPILRRCAGSGSGNGGLESSPTALAVPGMESNPSPPQSGGAIGFEDRVSHQADNASLDILASLPHLPKPYYQEPGITIYCADCREILPLLPDKSVDLVLTDPPYGIDLDYKGCNTRNVRRVITGDGREFDPAILLAFHKLILFGANNYCERLPRGGWIVWDKRIRNDKSDLANQCDGELAWTNLTPRILIFRHLWIGAFRDSEHGSPAPHPTQKPVALMFWAIDKFSQERDTILDPFMGSGTTLVAAKQLGRKAIGIEICEDYCRIAVERLRQSVLPFEPDHPAAEQAELL